MKHILDKVRTGNIFINITKVTAFVLIFSFLFVFVSYLIRPLGYNREIISGFYAEDPEELDAVYIGGSVCFVSWAPMIAFREQGIASYNYASDTIEADTIKYCIKEVLKTQSPKLFVIDARPFEYRDAEQPPKEVPIRNLSDCMPYSYNRTEMLLNIVPSVLKENALNYILDISKYHENWKVFNKDFYDYGSNQKENNNRGFYFVPDSTSLTIPDDKTAVIEKMAPSEDTVKILEDLLEFCKSKDLKVMFVVAPYAESDAHRSVYNYVSDQVESFGYDFINYNDYYKEMNIDFSTDFYNADHLNIFGAEKYTSYLAQNIVENYQIPDRRIDADYSDWFDNLADWDEDVNAAKHTIEQLQMTDIDNINDYLTYIDSKQYSVFIAVKDDASNALNQEACSSLLNLGLIESLKDQFRSSYIAVIDQGTVMYENIDNKKITTYGELSDGTCYSVVSAGAEYGNYCSIIIDGMEYAVNARGLNIVVYDNNTGSVADSVSFDTYACTFDITRTPSESEIVLEN